MKDLLSKCPRCQNDLTVTKYTCKKCKTEITGNFAQGKFASLSKEQLDFIEIFVQKRGNIKEIEKELNISYPTVRNKLDDVISALGHKVESSNSKIDILNMLNNGEITSQEATNLLSKL